MGIVLAEETTIALEKLRVGAENHGKELAPIAIKGISRIVATVLALEPKRQSIEINCGQIDVDGIALQQ